jgi:hypothetical protein
MTTRASVNSRLLVVEIRATSVIPEWSDEVLAPLPPTCRP